MTTGPYGNYEYLTFMGERANTGAPLWVFLEMQEKGSDFATALDSYAENEQKKQDQIFGVDELLGYEELYDLVGADDPDENMATLFDFYGDYLLEEIIAQEREYKEVVDLLLGTGMNPDAASAQADMSVRKISQEEVAFVEDMYPGILPLYDVASDKWDDLEATAELFDDKFGDIVGAALNEDDTSERPLVGLFSAVKDTLVGWAEAAVSPLAGAQVEEMEKSAKVTSDVGDFLSDKIGDIDDFIGNVTIGAMEQRELEGYYHPGTTRSLVVEDQMIKSLEDVTTEVQAVGYLMEAYNAGYIDFDEIAKVVSSTAFENAIEEAGLNVEVYNIALTEAVEKSDRFLGILPSDTEDETLPWTEPDWMLLGEPGYGPDQMPLEQDEMIKGVASDWQLLDPMGFPVGDTALEATPREPEPGYVPTRSPHAPGGPPSIVPTAATAAATATGGVAGGYVAGAAGQTASTVPGLELQFLGLYNQLEGSQTPQGQSYFNTLFNQAQNVYYTTIGWKEHPWYKPSSPSKDLSLADRQLEEAKFAEWADSTYLKDPYAARFGDEFYSGVRRIRDNLVDIAGWDAAASERLAELKKQGEDPAQHMMDQLFFGEDSDRMAEIVGMYNIYPGMARTTQSKIMAYYQNLMRGWLASKDPNNPGQNRTVAQFAKAFIGDQPSMFAGYKEGETDFVMTDAAAKDAPPIPQTEAEKIRQQPGYDPIASGWDDLLAMPTAYVPYKAGGLQPEGYKLAYRDGEPIGWVG